MGFGSKTLKIFVGNTCFFKGKKPVKNFCWGYFSFPFAQPFVGGGVFKPAGLGRRGRRSCLGR